MIGETKGSYATWVLRVVEENKDICFGEDFLKGMSEGLHMKNVTQDAKFAFNKKLLRKFPMSLAWEN